jgi:hypothetical protein
VADDPKEKKDTSEPSASSVSPAPTDVAEDPKDGNKSNTPPPPDPNSKVQAEPLSDGTTPTVLATGSSHRKVTKSKASITTIYRKADIITTLLTFGGVIVAGAIIVGAYYFFSKSKSGTPTPTPKVTKLDASDLNKLDSFFSGNSAGKPTEVLSINSSSLFNGRVAVNSDLKVTGGLSVDGTTTLGNLSATKTSNLGITNVGGQLTVNGPLTVQNPALFNAGATYKGNITASGNASFGGSLSAASISVQDLSVNGALNINGHLNIGGSNPSASPDQAAGSGASASVAGNDTAGTVTVSTGVVPGNGNLGGDLVKVTFHNTYPSVPTIVISADGRGSAQLQPFVLKSANWFIVVISFDAISHSSYSFDYWVAQ